MKNAFPLFLALFVLVSACGSQSEIDTPGGETGTDAPASTGTITDGPTTKTGTEPASCADVDLAPVIAVPEDVAGTVAMQLPPFGVPTVCNTIVMGLYLNDDVAPCEPPAAVDVVTFDVASLDDLAAQPITVAGGPLDLPPQEQWIATARPGVYEVRWHRPTSHGAGDIPIVGALVRPNLCPVTLACSDVHGLRYRTSGEWTALETGVYLGLDDCALAQ